VREVAMRSSEDEVQDEIAEIVELLDGNPWQ
jgi:hypothetical protein